MTGTIPDSLYNLTDLKELWLYENQFEGSIKSEIGNLKDLVYFSIYSNLFTGTLPSELGKCEKLGECHLSLPLSKPFHSLPDSPITITVEWVQFQDNQINGTVPNEVCLLRSKNLYNEDENIEVLKADCCAGSATNEPFIKCECCHTCCDHTTPGQCQNLEKDGSLGC
jgi:hypothetical protein